MSELARLGGSGPPPSKAQAAQAQAQTATPGPDPKIAIVRQHLERYRALTGQGKWAEAGKELEAIEAVARGR